MTQQSPAATLSEFKSCTIGDDNASQFASCATVEVPLTHEPGDNRTIELFVARIASKQKPATPDPLFLLAGGPGQSASESFPALLSAFRAIQSERDLILVDQRGTGRSHRLDCEAAVPAEQLEFDHEKVRAHSKACLEQLDIDPQFFTTSIAIKDLDIVRELLDVESVNLYGVSYGTRVALHYMRRFPDRVRSVILDAVVPPEVVLGADIPIHAQSALNKLYGFCKANRDCNTQFPDLETNTEHLLKQLKETPIEVTYEDVSTGRMRQMEFSDKHLAITLRLMTYSAHGVAILPSMLFDAYENSNFAPFARQARMQTQSLGASIATGMHNAVICTEDAPSQITNEQRTAAEDTYLGGELLESLASNCVAWPKGVLDDDLKTPFSSSIPTLILSGEADPITPPSYGQLVADQFTNARHIINDHQGHMQAPLGCVPNIMAQTVSTGSIAHLELGCLERLKAPAFFIDANGPLP